ncbi:MAG: chalcone isomerase family protein [Burkholderiales bacterium]
MSRASRGTLTVALALALGAMLAVSPAGASSEAASGQAGAAPTASPAPAAAPTAVTDLLRQPRVAGEGRLRWFGLQIYDARLFVTPDGVDMDRWTRTPFALELRYARKLLGEDIAQASLKEMARMGFGTEAQRAGWLETMRRLFPDVIAGDRLTGVHLPEGRAVFYRNDTRIGRVEDRQFVEAFFAIWLDPRTVAPDLRRSLLADPAVTARTGPAPR